MRTLEEALVEGERATLLVAEYGAKYVKPCDVDLALLYDEVARLQTELANERKQAWEAVKSKIVFGELTGNGCDKSAERNGIILASNILAERLYG